MDDFPRSTEYNFLIRDRHEVFEFESNNETITQSLRAPFGPMHHVDGLKQILKILSVLISWYYAGVSKTIYFLGKF